MSLSVYNQAQCLYSTYAYTNSSKYTENAVDSSTVSKNDYNVSNLTNALDTLDDASSVSISSIADVDSYVQNAYKLSQLDDYDALSDLTTTSETRLLSGKSIDFQHYMSMLILRFLQFQE
jgi:hypothetical protein